MKRASTARKVVLQPETNPANVSKPTMQISRFEMMAAGVFMAGLERVGFWIE